MRDYIITYRSSWRGSSWPFKRKAYSLPSFPKNSLYFTLGNEENPFLKNKQKLTSHGDFARSLLGHNHLEVVVDGSDGNQRALRIVGPRNTQFDVFSIA